ncbi:uncharacterized protein LOC125238280 [Leguminivora glycinivorella]|uniref:uncharacterized protein LOC125238280 n=1 Tax=Leguminivora glycinivorella TaxID=1035111 RepID=UPI00200D109E|nr:uncharacterized protein LOC125238280 [Leguminivora glycinivorella]
MSLEEFKSKIASGQTAWLQELTKDTLSKLVQELGLQTNPNPNIDELRKLLREYVKTRHTGHTMSHQATLPITSLENFSGGNWRSYEEQLNCYMLLHDISEDKKVPLLITKLTSNVYDILSGLCAPKLPINITYEELCKKLQEFYHPKINLAVHRARFMDRKQEEGETIKEYLLAVRKLAKDCDFTDVDEHLKERLLNGVHNETIRYEVLKMADASLAKLTAVAETAEMAFKLSAKPVDVFKLSMDRRKASQQPQKNRQQQQQQSKCLCCGKTGHWKDQCTLRFKYCSECGRKGHIYRLCPQKKPSLKTVVCSEEKEEDVCENNELDDMYQTLNLG